MKTSLSPAVLPAVRSLAALCRICPATVFAAIVGLGVAVAASGEIIEISAVGTISYLNGSNINPTVSVGTKVYFYATLDENAPPFNHSSNDVHSLDHYRPLHLSYRFGDVDVVASERFKWCYIDAFYDYGSVFGLVGRSDDQVSQALMLFLFAPGDLTDSRLPISDTFAAKSWDAILAIQERGDHDGMNYYYGTMLYDFDRVTVRSIPEPGTYGLLGAGTLVFGLCLARRARRNRNSAGLLGSSSVPANSFR